jgi:hypothetical protein
MSEVNERLLNVSHPPAQRALDDVLVRVTPRSGPARVMYLSHGRAMFALARYPRSGLRANPNQRFVVERLGPKQEASS